MEYKVESTLERFDAWSGGKDTLEVLIRKGDCEEVESFLEDLFYDKIPTETEINDVLWFERDMIAEHLGYKDWEAYEEGYSLSDVEDADEWFRDIDSNKMEVISGFRIAYYDDEDDFLDDVQDWWDDLSDKKKVEIYYEYGI